MLLLKEYFKKAKQEKFAIPHFNFSNFEILKAIFQAAQNEKSPVMAGLSIGERNYFGIKNAVAIVKSLRNQYNFPIFLNADHTEDHPRHIRNFESCKECIDAGFDSVHFDGSDLPFEKNVEMTKKIVDYAKSKNPNIMIEGELGHIPGTSTILKEEIKISEDQLTKPDEAYDFVSKTGIDRLAVAIGTDHGISLVSTPKIDFKRLQDISSRLPNNYIVLHGGSGTKDEDFKRSIENGISNIHINTDIRVAYKEELKKAINKDEFVPYKYLKDVVDNLASLISLRIRIFGASNKI